MRLLAIIIPVSVNMISRWNFIGTVFYFLERHFINALDKLPVFGPVSEL